MIRGRRRHGGPGGTTYGSTKGHPMAAQESDVSKEVKAALEVDPRVDLHRFPIQVVVVNEGGRALRLEGEVQSIAPKRVAMTLAQRVCGNARVVDALRLVPT